MSEMAIKTPEPLPDQVVAHHSYASLARGIWIMVIVSSALGARIALAQISPLTSIKSAGITNVFPSNDVFSTMATLDNTQQLSFGDHLSFRIIEDQVDPRESLEPKQLVVTDSGDVEVPYIGRFPAAGKTCRRLAHDLKVELEKEYYYQATVIIAIDTKTRISGRVYITGEVRQSGPVDMPADEAFTLSKAVLRAGGFSEFADKRHVKVTRKLAADKSGSKSFIVDLNQVMEQGKTEQDVKLETDDAIFVPSRLFNF
jgi:protein involved in polysaccharide export with SLBB domain